MLPLRPSADVWIQSAPTLVLVEGMVAILIGPVLLATVRALPAGFSRLFAPGAVLLQGAAYAILYFLWQATSAPTLVGIGYAASVMLRATDLAKADGNALLEHTARMMIWFISIVLAAFASLVLSLVGAMSANAGAVVPWAVKACAVYFLLLAAGEVMLPFFCRNMDPRILPGDRIARDKAG